MPDALLGLRLLRDRDRRTIEGTTGSRRGGRVIGHTWAVVEGELSRSDRTESELLASAPEEDRGLGGLELRSHVPADMRDVSFPLAMRGYSRRAVDAYVERVNHLIAELEVSRSPRAAVRHALDRVTEQVGGILERARETAEEITSSARKEAEESTARAKAEAAELVVNTSDEADRTRAEAEEILAKARAEAGEILARSRAEAEETLTQSRAEAAERVRQSEKELGVLRELAEARMRELHADTEAVWEERGELLDDIRGMAARLEEAARQAAARLPSLEPAERAEEGAPESEAEPQPTGVAANRALGPREGGHGEAPEQEPR